MSNAILEEEKLSNSIRIYETYHYFIKSKIWLEPPTIDIN